MEEVKSFLGGKKVDETERRLDAGINNLYKILKSLEYKFWQSNDSTNKILYQLILRTCTKKKDFHPLVSIIIPVYNGSNYMKKAIDSALNQSYKNIEIIVINDGSTDGGKTDAIAKSYGKKIRYYYKENGGVSSALNLGIEKMKGEYFSWLSHDDIMDNNHIANLLEWVSFTEHEKDIPFSSFKFIDEDGNILFDDTIRAQIHCNDFKLSYIKNEASLLQGEINGGSVLIPVDAFEEAGNFDEKLRVAQEREMWSRLMSVGYHFVNIPFDTASIRCHPNQVTNTNTYIAKESNEKKLDILDGISTERKIELFGDQLTFLEHVNRFTMDNGNIELAKEIRQRIEREKRDKKDRQD